MLTAPVLKFKEDRRTVAFAFFAFGLMLLPYWMAYRLGSLPLFLYPVFFLVQTFTSYVCGAINHNHTHVHIFKSRRWNLLFNILLGYNMGRAVSLLIVIHNMNHHSYLGTHKDWSSPFQIGNHRGILGLLYYTGRIFYEMTVKQDEQANSKTHPALMRRVRIEQVMFVPLLAFFLYTNWKVFFFCTWLGWMVGMAGTLAINVIQHSFCDLNSKINNSRNFISPIYNWVLFNAGYHTYHHEFPYVHWSKLPAIHKEKIDPFIRPDLNERSFYRFLFMEFLPAGPEQPIAHQVDPLLTQNQLAV